MENYIYKPPNLVKRGVNIWEKGIDCYFIQSRTGDSRNDKAWAERLILLSTRAKC